MAAATWRAIATENPDVLITFTHYANVLGQTGAMFSRIPTRIASQRNTAAVMPRLAKWADAAIGSLGGYHANVMVSRAVAAGFGAYPNHYRRRTLVIPNGIAPPLVVPSRAETRMRLGLPAEGFIVACVGRLAAMKNQACLVRMLVHTRPELHLALIGDGPNREALELLSRQLGVRERVHFLGEFSRNYVLTILPSFDAFALASYEEGMSNAVLEALGAGIPTLASDIPSQREILEQSGTLYGLLLPPNDPLAWAQGINMLLTEPSEHHKWKLLASTRANHFRVEVMVERFASLIVQLRGVPSTHTQEEANRSHSDARSYGAGPRP